MQKVIIGVIGSSDKDAELSALAESVGTLVARAGMVLLNGGLGGVMLASAKGASEAGGLTVGILPGLDVSEANPYIDIPIATGMGQMRNLLIIRAASALIAVGGGYGTLSEIALGLKAGRPVVGLKSWDVCPDMIVARDPDDAFEKAVAAAGGA